MDEIRFGAGRPLGRIGVSALGVVIILRAVFASRGGADDPAWRFARSVFALPYWAWELIGYLAIVALLFLLLRSLHALIVRPVAARATHEGLMLNMASGEERFVWAEIERVRFHATRTARAEFRFIEIEPTPRSRRVRATLLLETRIRNRSDAEAEAWAERAEVRRRAAHGTV